MKSSSEKQKIKAVLFDFDMTLVNSMPTARASFRALCKISRVKMSKKGFDDYIGRRFLDSLEFFSKKSKVDKQILINAYIRAHLENLWQVSVYGRKALNFLKKNKITIIIVSRNRRDILLAETKSLKIPYDYLFSDEDMNKGEEKHQLILRIIKRFKLKRDEVYYIGDHINDILEAKKAGVKIISVTTGVFKAKDLIPFKPDFIIEDLNNLIEIIK